MRNNKILAIIFMVVFCVSFCFGNYAYATENIDENVVIEESTEESTVEDEITEEKEEVIDSEKESTVENEITEEKEEVVDSEKDSTLEEEVEENSSNRIENKDSYENYTGEDFESNSEVTESYNEYADDYSERYESLNESELSEAELNTDLKSLSISDGVIIPKFESSTYKYTIYFTSEKQIENLKVEFEAISSYAEIDYKMGEDNFYIYLENGRGEYSLYNFYYHVLKENEILIKNSLYILSDFNSKEDIPKGFDIGEKKVNDCLAKFLESCDKHLRILRFENSENKNDVKWFYFKKDLKQLQECKMISVSGSNYTKVPGEKDIFYGVGEDGPGYYTYNSKYKKIIKFVGTDINKYKEKIHLEKIIGFSLGIVVIVVGIMIALKISKKKKRTVKQRPYLSIEE